MKKKKERPRDKRGPLLTIEGRKKRIEGDGGKKKEGKRGGRRGA